MCIFIKPVTCTEDKVAAHFLSILKVVIRTHIKASILNADFQSTSFSMDNWLTLLISFIF